MEGIGANRSTAEVKLITSDYLSYDEFQFCSKIYISIDGRKKNNSILP